MCIFGSDLRAVARSRLKPWMRKRCLKLPLVTTKNWLFRQQQSSLFRQEITRQFGAILGPKDAETFCLGPKWGQIKSLKKLLSAKKD